MQICIHGKNYEQECEECEKEVKEQLDPLNTGIFSGINAKVARHSGRLE